MLRPASQPFRVRLAATTRRVVAGQPDNSDDAVFTAIADALREALHVHRIKSA